MNINEQIQKLKAKVADNEAKMVELRKENVEANRSIRKFETLSLKAQAILDGSPLPEEEEEEEETQVAETTNIEAQL